MKNSNITNNGGKNTQKECQIPDWPNKSQNRNLQDTGVWVSPGRDGWRFFEGGTGSTFPMASYEEDDDDSVRVLY